MNARNFFSQSDFERLQKIRENQEIVRIMDTPFRRTVKVNGNVYTLSIVSGRYVGSGSYYMSCWHDFNHKSKTSGDRQIYGGTGSEPVLTSYEAFCDDINRILKHTPDYEEEQEEQLRFF